MDFPFIQSSPQYIGPPTAIVCSHYAICMPKRAPDLSVAHFSDQANILRKLKMLLTRTSYLKPLTLGNTDRLIWRSLIIFVLMHMYNFVALSSCLLEAFIRTLCTMEFHGCLTSQSVLLRVFLLLGNLLFLRESALERILQRVKDSCLDCILV